MSAVADAAKPPRNGHIDCARGAAILAVLLLHFALAYRLQHCPLQGLLTMAQLRALFYNGNYGVTVFFVVSGYLICTLSMQRWGSLSRIDPWAFYRLRLARLLPALLLVLAIVVVLGCLRVPYFRNEVGGQPLPPSYFLIAVASVLTFWHNILMQSAGWFNYCLNIYWSLSVEEVFYLALPVLCLFLRRSVLLIGVCATLIVWAPIYRDLHADDEILFECSNLACFDAIALGVLTALAARRWRIAGPRATVLRAVALVALCIAYLRGIEGHEALGFTQVALCTSVYLASAVNDTRAGLADSWALAPLRWLGQHSYELYLFHIVILAGLRNVLDRQELPAFAWMPWLLLFLALSSLAGWLIARYVSEPANQRLRGLRWSQAGKSPA